MKKLFVVLLAVAMLFTFAACSQDTPGDTPADITTADGANEATAKEPVTIMVAAAASLENTYVNELIPAFQAKYDWITVEGTYDSSGKLQTQIEEGLAADVFMSAATKQMNALVESALVDADSVVELLENKIVLIEPASTPSGIAGFENAADAAVIAIGDPESVPAGQYAQEIFTNLGIWDQVSAKASLGTNVTEVLSWVAEGSADIGVVYATDAASNDGVAVITEAPAQALTTKVIYPVGVVTNSANKEAAQLFVDFLKSDEAIAIFEAAGFTSNL